MNCPHCGAQNEVTAESCGSCGTSMMAPINVQLGPSSQLDDFSSNSRSTANNKKARNAFIIGVLLCIAVALQALALVNARSKDNFQQSLSNDQFQTLLSGASTSSSIYGYNFTLKLNLPGTKSNSSQITFREETKVDVKTSSLVANLTISSETNGNSTSNRLTTQCLEKTCYISSDLWSGTSFLKITKPKLKLKSNDLQVFEGLISGTESKSSEPRASSSPTAAVYSFNESLPASKLVADIVGPALPPTVKSDVLGFLQSATFGVSQATVSVDTSWHILSVFMPVSVTVPGQGALPSQKVSGSIGVVPTTISPFTVTPPLATKIVQLTQTSIHAIGGLSTGPPTTSTESLVERDSTQTDLANIYTSALAVYATTGSFGTGTGTKFVKELSIETPSVTFVNVTSIPSTEAGKLVVGVTVLTKTIVMIYARDANGGCWGISHATETITNTTIPTGTFYWWSTAKSPSADCSYKTLVKSPETTTSTFRGPRLTSKS